MASFTNFATLSYNGGTTNSNIVTGEILEALTAVKTAVSANYSAGGRITYAISLVNTGTTAITGYTVTDDLGGYTVGENTVYPLAYNAGTVRYYINGVLQASPTVTAGPPLTVTGLTVPAGGSAVLIYETTATNVAPLATGGSITNTAAITGGGLINPITAQATVETANSADLTISKALSPTTVTENGQITYTFVISNTGNTEAAAVSGVNVAKTIILVYLIAGILYGTSAFLEAARITSVGANTGINYETDAISAVVVGGVSFSGGVGTIQGVVIGAIILQAINYGLYFLGVNAYLQYIIRGAIIIIAVAIDVQKYVAKK